VRGCFRAAKVLVMPVALCRPPWMESAVPLPSSGNWHEPPKSTRMKKKTVIIGATPNPGRYAYLAANMLREYDHPIVPLGIRQGEVGGQPIQDIRTNPPIEDVDTVTLYLAPRHQSAYYDYILGLKPRRIIFNPGTENEAFMKLARAHNVEVEQACSLVLLRSHQY